MNKVGELELIRESLVAVVNEMRANVIHASFSSIIYEGRDFSCALLTREGQLLAQSLDDNPIHIFAVPYSAREVIARYGDRIADGDIFLHNDPYSGGTHLNDILLLEPIFAEGHLIAFAAVRCHWGDVGGMTAGSISGRATEIFQEGVRIPAIRIATRGEVNVEITDLLFANMRVPTERRGDFNTMIGASRKAIEHVRRLVRRFGRTALLTGIDSLLRNAELVMREKIRACTPGVYCSEGYVENNGHTDTPLAARLRLTVQDGAVDVDFWDASPQTAGPTNVGPAMAINSAGTILKAFLDPDSPMNHGSFRPITVHAPERTFINARPPVACGGSVEVKALLDAMIAGALGQAVPEKMVGDLKGGGNHIYISGSPLTAREHRFFLFYEYPAAGTGATRRGDGSHVTRTYTEGDFNSIGSAEVIESEMPLRVERTAIRAGSHGHGQHRGGCGMTRDIRILDEAASLSVLSDKNVIPPYGVAGAHSGKGNRFVVLRGGEVIAPSPLPGKVADFHLQVNDVVRMETAGGGGYGDPLRRDLARIADDVRLGYTPCDDASRHYGVVIDDAGVIDEPATQTHRTMLAEGRVFMDIADDDTDCIDDERRWFSVTQAVADALGVATGALCELLNPRGPSLRGWVRIDRNGSNDRKLALGPFARSILRAVPGDRIEIRPVGLA
jgi:N-methylhydantoinase B